MNNNKPGWPFHPRFPQGPSQPNAPRAYADLGPGALARGNLIPASVLTNVIENGSVSEALQAQSLLTQRVQQVNYSLYNQTFYHAPSGSGVHVYLQYVQVLAANPNRKTLSLQCYATDTVAGASYLNIGSNLGVYYGVIFQNGPNQITDLDDGATQATLQRTLLLGEVGFFPQATALPYYEFNPVPTNPVTLVVYYGPAYADTGFNNNFVVIEGT